MQANNSRTCDGGESEERFSPTWRQAQDFLSLFYLFTPRLPHAPATHPRCRRSPLAAAPAQCSQSTAATVANEINNHACERLPAPSPQTHANPYTHTHNIFFSFSSNFISQMHHAKEKKKMHEPCALFVRVWLRALCAVHRGWRWRPRLKVKAALLNGTPPYRTHHAGCCPHPPPPAHHPPPHIHEPSHGPLCSTVFFLFFFSFGSMSTSALSYTPLQPPNPPSALLFASLSS